MNKKILVLTGGTRVNGNSQLMADSFIEGAESAGHEIKRYDAGFKNLKGCVFCETCYKNDKGNACSHDEEFSELASYYESCDMLVMVSPLYWYTFTAQFKAALDKYYALMVADRPQPIKEVFLLTCGGTDDLKNFDGIINTYHSIVKDRKWNDKGYYIVPEVFNKGDINKEDLNRIKEIGRNI